MKRENKKSNALFEGVKEFKEKDFVIHQEIFKNLEKNQNPHTLFIGCSDSRVVPNLITKSLPGELFIIRNVANLVPFFRKDLDAHLATSSAIEYAVNVLEVENIIVCGHSNCGGCRALYASESKLKNLPMTKKWLELAQPVKALVKEKIKTEKTETCKRDELTAQLNVIEQMKHLLTFPYIKERLDKGKLNILGWYYVIETGEVFNYSPEKQIFERIE
ncbi:Carbonic anhydrase [uncultured Paludibacter sp.]|uniref:Carbonic anhydrase n=1 Tax=uncultured Paludibacter sp. TaxID=497635 RepID=A0A653AKM4_9BACT|nr:Carbonic anhydrase [uncultured Paludibacter sp.]